MMIKKLPKSRGKTAFWKDWNESGVRVKPTSLSKDADVKMPLDHVVSKTSNSKFQDY